VLGGGFPRRRLSEIAGPASSGRTSVALALLARATRAGELAAVVDAADAFDPASAEAAGARLERVLWVRAPGLREALRSAERLLEAGGFALVLLDLATPSLRCAPAVWPRLARAATTSSAALVTLRARREAGTAAELAVEMKPPSARFSGTPLLLDGLEIEAALVRHRTGPAQRSACVRLRPRAAA
jgi:RecA/RadA recombinase